ncbi:DUF2066 domain-containing protein [Azospirillum sp.]|uniref:DUF2066 domain-containing protein n=1 Tax=Azospirillum sp. TaxID=34012 RepID=UPI003D73C128
MLHRSRRALCAVIAALLLALAGHTLPARAQVAPAAQADAFTVSGVKVDVTTANPNAGRDQAISEAQRKAWDTLYQRLVPGGKAPRLSDHDLARLVAGFEIDEEKLAANRYVGTMTVRFRPQAVRDQLGGSGAAYVEPPSQPLVVLPVTVVDGKPILWEDRTPWRSAWEARERGSSLVPLVVPEGEMEDLQAIGAQDAVNGAADPLAAIARRYSANGVVVARTTLPASGEPTRGQPLAVDVVRYGLDGSREQFPVSVRVDADDRPADALARGVTFVAAALDEAWKRDNTAVSGGEQTVAVAVPVGRLEDWIETRKRLATVQAVTRADLLSLSRMEALVALTFRGDVERLRQAMARRDLGLTQAAPRVDAGVVPAPALELRALPRGAGASQPAAPLPAAAPVPPPMAAPAGPGVVMGAPPRDLGTIPARRY